MAAPVRTSRAAIRTPDQRLRVFVSSTLTELAAERRAVRAAIERLGAAPVMFELGARPHPPRTLYRSYLEQSDVFVGIYGERYGWIGPGETVSGVEDEYNLAPPSMPRLVYIRDTAGAREPRLEALLARVLEESTTSFKFFPDAAELGDLVATDLAVLLAERFDQSQQPEAPPVDEAATTPPLPQPLTELVGRERDVEAVAGLLGSARLVTLTGPGGIGKSRLALAAAGRVAADYPVGVAFVPLAAIEDAAEVPTALAQALGVGNSGGEPLPDKLETALRPRRLLLVLDNLERVLAIGPLVSRLLAAAPGLTVLATSRTLLSVSGEHRYEVGPLAVRSPTGDATDGAAVQLFALRARAVRPDFALTTENRGTIERIVTELDGMPLAIELAAARMRLLAPAELLRRLDDRLSILSGGPRDLPERQRTLRATLDWSAQQLSEDERRTLTRLSVFAGWFGLEAAEAVLEPDGVDALAVLGSLVDTSLLHQEEYGGRGGFRMLRIVRDYAAEQLDGQGDSRATRDRHAAHYLTLGRHLHAELDGRGQRERLLALAAEHDNIRAAIRHLLDERQWDEAAEFAWSLFLYWWLAEHLAEARDWMAELLGGEGHRHGTSTAVALYFTCAIDFWDRPSASVVAGLVESAHLFADADRPEDEALALISVALGRLAAPPHDPGAARTALDSSIALFRDARNAWGEGMALITMGRVDLATGDLSGAENRFAAAVALAEERSDGFGAAVALHNLGASLLLRGDLAAAAEATGRSLRLSVRLAHQEGIAYGLEGFAGIAAARDDADRAGRLLGAAQALRDRVGRQNPPGFAFHEPAVARLRAAGLGARFDLAAAEGAASGVQDAVSLALTAEARQPAGSAAPA